MDPTAAADLKEMIGSLIELAKAGGPFGFGIAIVLVVIYFGLKWSGAGFAIGSRKTLVDDGKMDGVARGVDEIKSKMTVIEGRMNAVERDLETRATRQEIHDIELAFAKFEGRLAVMEEVSQQTHRSVQRIEGYMFEYGVRGKT